MSLGKRTNERFAAMALVVRPILLLSLSLAMSGCGPSEPAAKPDAIGGNKSNSMETKDKQSQLPEIKSASNLSLPADTQVLLDEKGREGDGYRRWVLYSKEGIHLPAEGRITIPAASTMQSLEKLLPDRMIGKLSNPDAQTSEWKNQRGSWRATEIMTENGSYLDLEHFGDIK